MKARLCEVCEENEGDRYVTIEKASGGKFTLWLCPKDALWMVGAKELEEVR